MARITIEDCMEQVPNRFELVRMASIRAKQLKKGARPLIEPTNKEVVTSLREIAAGLVQPGTVEVPEAPSYDAAEFDPAPAVTEEAAPAEAEAAAEVAPALDAPAAEEPPPEG